MRHIAGPDVHGPEIYRYAQSNGIRRPQGFDPFDFQIPQQQPDRFTARSEKRNSSNDGKFSIFTAAKEFVKGAVVRPIKAMIKHPLLTIGTLAAAALAVSAAPILLPIMVMGGLAYGAYQIGKGASHVASHLRNGRYDDAERAFGDIGEGVFAVATSALGARSAAGIVAEAKAASAVNSATTAAARTAALENSIAAGAKARSGSLASAGKELITLFTTKAGRSAIAHQLRPSAFFPAVKGKALNFAGMFKEPAKVDTEGIIAKVQKQLNISDENMPKIVSSLDDLTGGQRVSAAGMYKPGEHKFWAFRDPLDLIRNQLPQDKAHLVDKLPRPIRNFLGNLILKRFNPENVIAHELTHAKQFEAIRHLPRSQAQELLNSIPLEGHANGRMFGVIPFRQDLKTPEGAEMFRSMLLGELKLADDVPALSGEKLDAARQALTRMVNTAKANSQVQAPIVPGDVRSYIADGAEMEARIAGSRFAERDALLKFGKDLEIAPDLIARVRNVTIERRLNELVSGIEAMKKAPMVDAAKIQAMEAELQALNKLWGHTSMTGGLVDKEAKVARMSARVEKIQAGISKAGEWKQQFSGHSPGWLQRLRTATDSIRNRAAAFFKN